MMGKNPQFFFIKKSANNPGTYPDEDEDLGVPDPVLALRHPQHRELRGTLTLRHQITNLENKNS